MNQCLQHRHRICLGRSSRVHRRLVLFSSGPRWSGKGGICVFFYLSNCLHLYHGPRICTWENDHGRWNMSLLLFYLASLVRGIYIPSANAAFFLVVCTYEFFPLLLVFIAMMTALYESKWEVVPNAVPTSMKCATLKGEAMFREQSRSRGGDTWISSPSNAATRNGCIHPLIAPLHQAGGFEQI